MTNSFGHHFPPEVERLIAENEAERTFHSDLDRTLHAFWKSGMTPDEAARIFANCGEASEPHDRTQ